MFHKKTVFVLGAGFSQEFKMPVGGGLAGAIGALLSSDGPKEARFRNLMRAELRLGERVDRVCRDMAGALKYALSIDNLVEHYSTHEDFPLVAKHAIARAILDAERKANIKAARAGAQGYELSESCAKSAAAAITLLALRGVSRGNIHEAFRNVAFINFNYDRCFDAYIYTHLREYSLLSHKEVLEILEDLSVWRPYGHLGPISGPEGPDRTIMPLGAPEDDERLMRLLPFASKLKTFSESEASPGHEEAKRWIAEAEQIIFLGCAYHPQNLELLGDQPLPGRRPRIYGTYYRPPPTDPGGQAQPSMAEFIGPGLEALADRLLQRLCEPGMHRFEDGAPNLHGLTCRQLVDMYEHTWTAP